MDITQAQQQASPRLPIVFDLEELWARLPEIAWQPPSIGYWVSGDAVAHDRTSMRRMNLLYGARVLWQGGRFEITDVRFYENGEQKHFYQYEELERFVRHEVRGVVRILTMLHTPYTQMKEGNYRFAAKVKAAAGINEQPPNFIPPDPLDDLLPQTYCHPMPGSSARDRLKQQREQLQNARIGIQTVYPMPEFLKVNDPLDPQSLKPRVQ